MVYEYNKRDIRHKNSAKTNYTHEKMTNFLKPLESKSLDGYRRPSRVNVPTRQKFSNTFSTGPARSADATTGDLSALGSKTWPKRRDMASFIAACYIFRNDI
jgi:hypothetical protein